MASNKPVVRQIAWISLIPNFILFVLLVYLVGRIAPPAIASYLIIILYMFIILALRNIPRNHRRGMKFFKSGQYVQAISEFQKSYEFFTRHAWIDKYRYFVLLSSSRISYTEMALLNTAFCYTQIGEGALAKESYEKTLAQFPDSEMAKSALRMMQSLTDENE